ncbi:MAG: lysophospholipid acyltransferase family protein [Gemmatimonadaceae bacterium]
MKATLSQRIEFYSMRGLLNGLNLLSWETACRIGARLGAAGYKPLGIRKRVVEKQIAGAFPEKSHEEVQRIARASFEHLGRTAIETALLPRQGERAVLKLVEQVDGWENVERARSEGKGMIFVAGHHGNWELLGGYIAARGIPFEVIARGMGNPLFGEFVNEIRTSLGMEVMHDSDAVKRTPRALRAGKAVGFLSDQGVKGLASTYVTFLGRPAKTPRGAAVFALRFNAPVFFVDGIRLPNGKYRVIIEPVEVTLTGNREKDIDAIVIRFTELLEKWVRKVPEQYFWQHRRWRRQPEDTPPELRDPTLDV